MENTIDKSVSFFVIYLLQKRRKIKEKKTIEQTTSSAVKAKVIMCTENTHKHIKCPERIKKKKSDTMTRNIEHNAASMHNAGVPVFVQKCLYLDGKRCYINYNNEDCTFCMPFVLLEIGGMCAFLPVAFHFIFQFFVCSIGAVR